MRLIEASVRALGVLDEAWCLRINRASALRPVRVLFRVVSRLGDGLLWYLTMALLLAVDGARAIAPVLHMIVVGTAGVLAYKWLKQKTSRPRPYRVRSAIRLGADPLDAFSFPSGHTLHAVAFATLLTAYYPALAVPLWSFAGLVGASRIVLGLHYPSDVLAGAVIGATLALGSLEMLQR
jgi:undecaprenyl-diphosphatase